MKLGEIVFGKGKDGYVLPIKPTRDEIAMAAMKGILSNPNINPYESPDANKDVAEVAYWYADAMIEQSNKGE
jgi:hypothetical protein